MKKILVLTLFLMFTNLFAQTKTIVFVSEEWEGQTNADGTGNYYEIIKAIYEPEYKVEFKRVPWSRASKEFRDGQYDGLIAENSFDKGMIRPKNFLYKSKLTAFFSKDFTFKGEETLKTAKISWVRGYNFEKLASFPIKFEEYDTAATGFKMLEAKRTDVFIDYGSDFATNCKKSKINCNNISQENSGINETAYIAFHDNESGKKLAEIYDQKIEPMVKAGKVQEIFKKYGFEYEP